MNTDELSTGGASPSAESKKREGRKHCLGYSNWSLLLWSWWGGKMGCGCAGRGIAQEYPFRSKAEPCSGREVLGGGGLGMCGFGRMCP